MWALTVSVLIITVAVGSYPDVGDGAASSGAASGSAHKAAAKVQNGFIMVSVSRCSTVMSRLIVIAAAWATIGESGKRGHLIQTLRLR